MPVEMRGDPITGPQHFSGYRSIEAFIKVEKAVKPPAKKRQSRKKKSDGPKPSFPFRFGHAIHSTILNKE
jgi:hypothetical protein